MARPPRPRRTVRLLTVTSLVAPAVTMASVVAVAPAAEGLIGTCRANTSVQTLDLTGDGLPDWAVGEPGKGADAGAVHVVSHVAGGYRDVRLAQGAPVVPGGPAVPGTAEPGDRFGAAAVIGDFDTDGCGDLAVGAPGENDGRGTVTIIYGGSDAAVPFRVVTEGMFAGATARPGEHFGAVLEVADMDGTGGDDLVIGIPDERVTATGTSQGGFGIVSGFQLTDRAFPQRLVTASSLGVPGTAENGDRFAASLAVADFDLDEDLDLAVGVPGENRDAGAVVVFSLISSFSAASLARAIDQDTPGVPGTAEPGDRFGWSLAAGDVGFRAEGIDLAVGAPGENAGAGAVTFVPGSVNGITGAGAVVRSQDTAGVAGVAQAGDRFGTSVVVTRLDEQSFVNSIVVGAPGDVVSGHAGAGSVTVLAQTATGPNPDDADVRVGLLSQDTSGMPGAAEAGDGFGTTLAAVQGRSLLIGVPGEDLGGVANAGGVNWLDGTDGLEAFPNPTFVEADTPGIVGVRDTGGRFGSALDG
ncbi:FG-GAP repeat protein [Kineosporia sp. A_224]|uniref:integrin alpha n=1 Tax=Kineosporia sp. A_224 TaxID=1962180 RepID=UPI000B4AC0FF|nr:FG-GAP repeat protein [Kineosporia sp. A_224]